MRAAPQSVPLNTVKGYFVFPCDVAALWMQHLEPESVLGRPQLSVHQARSGLRVEWGDYRARC